MSLRRGEIVVVDLPFAGGGGSKVRPAIVIQNDPDNRRLANTVVAMISGNISHAHEPTQLLIDPATAEGESSGLNGPSVVKCVNIYTIRQVDAIRVIGAISVSLVPKLDACLKCAIGLS